MRLKNILFLIITIVLCFPAVQMYFKLIEITPLNGAYYPASFPSFNLENFTAGTFQNEADAYIQKHDDIRPPLIKLHNQLHYWLTGKSTNFVVVGKQNQLYSYDYWSSFIGFNYKGYPKLVEDVLSIKQLQDSLQTIGKEFLYVIAPNKIRYMPEHLPDELRSIPGDTSNYNTILRLFKQYKVHYLDLNGLFKEHKEKYKYPLFANTSIHWSAYGMSLGLQKILDSLESMSHQNIINLKFNSWQLKEESLNSDKDMSDLMNLIWPIKTELLAFPEVRLDTVGRAKPAKLFVVGDSFFWNMYALSFRLDLLEHHSHFYYYNRKDINPKSLEEFDLNNRNARVDVEFSDFVIFVTTEANLGNLTYDFPQRFFEDSKKCALVN